MASDVNFESFDVRGFVGYRFEDRYGEKCSVQESSLATENAIWFGIDNPVPKRLVQNEGWVPLDLGPGEVLISGRMHLTQEQVKALLPTLQHFAEHGSLPSTTLPTPAVGAAGEAVAWAADGTNIYGNFGRVFLTDEKQVEQYASSNYKITPLYAQPSAGAFTDAQCLEVAKAVDNCIRNHLTESQFLIAAVRAALTARPASEGREDA